MTSSSFSLHERAGQATAPVAVAVGLLVALLWVFLLRPSERTVEGVSEVEVRYVSDMRSALRTSKGSSVETGPGASEASRLGDGPAAATRPSSKEDSPGPVLPGLASLVAGGGVEVVELGHSEGDFMYRAVDGWIKLESRPQFEAATPRIRPVAGRDLPSDLRQRYPETTFPARGRTAESRAMRSAGGSVPREGPWKLRKELPR